jgi:hypothetical protein
MITQSNRLDKEAKAWLKRRHGPDEVIRIIPAFGGYDHVTSYKLYTAFENDPDFLGQILFDAEGYWIYDGDVLTVDEQEQAARFIINYIERI